MDKILIISVNLWVSSQNVVQSHDSRWQYAEYPLALRCGMALTVLEDLEIPGMTDKSNTG